MVRLRRMAPFCVAGFDNEQLSPFVDVLRCAEFSWEPSLVERSHNAVHDCLGPRS